VPVQYPKGTVCSRGDVARVGVNVGLGQGLLPLLEDLDAIGQGLVQPRHEVFRAFAPREHARPPPRRARFPLQQRRPVGLPELLVRHLSHKLCGADWGMTVPPGFSCRGCRAQLTCARFSGLHSK